MPVGVRSPSVGNVRSFFVPMASVTAFPVMTAAMVTGGTELTKYEISDSKVGLGGSNSVNEKAIGDLANTDVPTYATYSGSLHLFRSASGGLAGTDDLLSVFSGKPFFYYVRRTFKANTVAIAATDVVEAYLFQADWPAIEANDGGAIKLMVPLFQQGVFNLALALT